MNFAKRLCRRRRLGDLLLVNPFRGRDDVIKAAWLVAIMTVRAPPASQRPAGVEQRQAQLLVI
jgi:hypothetical protein